LNILFLADAVFADKPGGSRVVARELAKGLVERGHQVTFLVARQDDAAPEDECRAGVRIVRYPGAGNPIAFIREGRRAAARLWAEGGFDVVHTHFAYAAVGPLAALPSSVPHVRTFHGPWHEEGWFEDTLHGESGLSGAKARVKRALRRRAEVANLRRSDLITVLSRHFAEEVTNLGYPAERIRTIPGGVDVARFVPAPDRAAVRQTLDLPTDCPVLFSVRRLAPRMGLDNLISAMPAVVARHPKVLLLIGGKGPEKERLERLIVERGLSQNVRLVGFIPDEQLAAYYQAADAFVLPTVALEGFGLVTVESLACGTPVLGTPVGATPEILSGLDSRLILPGTTPEHLAVGINAYLDAPWRHELTSDRLRRFVLDNYTWEQHVSAMEAVYAEVIAAHAA
jgi:glycosyltransferase involved in cell wall biosynthesis